MSMSIWLIGICIFLTSIKYVKCKTFTCGQSICFTWEDCCNGQCCLKNMYDVDDKSDSPSRILSYDYYTHSFWNVWYFWFIVIFLAISCFGGCGYWRRHRYNHRLSHHRIDSNRFPRERCNTRVPTQTFDIPNEQPESGSFPNSSLPPLRFIHQVGNYLHPPPYSEVTSKPDMYPLVQGRNHLDLSKTDPLAFVYANTNFIHFYMPYNAAGTINNYIPSPVESNTSSAFQSTTTSNFMSPPPYNDEITCQSFQTRVSTPCSILSACTPNSYVEPYTFTTHYLSTLSPPMATTPTSQQLFSEVTTPGADSLIESPTSFQYNRYIGDNLQLPNDPFTTSQEHLLTALVTDIENMTNQSINDAMAAEPNANNQRLNLTTDFDESIYNHQFKSRSLSNTTLQSRTSSHLTRDSLSSNNNGNGAIPHSLSLGSHELRNNPNEDKARCSSEGHLT